MINCARMCGIAVKYDVLLGDNQLSQLNTYAKLLVSWNEVMNLTAITQAEEIEEKHFLDCLQNDREPECNAADHVRTMELCEKMLEALK